MRVGRACETYGPANHRARCCSRFCPCSVLAAVQWEQPEECKEQFARLRCKRSGRQFCVSTYKPREARKLAAEIERALLHIQKVFEAEAEAAASR